MNTLGCVLLTCNNYHLQQNEMPYQLSSGQVLAFYNECSHASKCLNYPSMYLTHRVRTVTVTQTVPQRGEVCSLKKIWKNPRTVKETTPGLTCTWVIIF